MQEGRAINGTFDNRANKTKDMGRLGKLKGGRARGVALKFTTLKGRRFLLLGEKATKISENRRKSVTKTKTMKDASATKRKRREKQRVQKRNSSERKQKTETGNWKRASGKWQLS